MTEHRLIHCCGCDQKVQGRLTDGRECYPHRPDLAGLPFWKCDGCRSFVGCHHKTANRTQPLGSIPTPELKNARQHIHKLLDPMWQSKRFKRTELYQKMSDLLGWEYHTAKIRSVEEARKVYRALLLIKRNAEAHDAAAELRRREGVYRA